MVQGQGPEEEEEIQAKGDGSSQSGTKMPEIHNHINSLNGKGRSLSQAERSFFEPRFGCDFSGVRIHNDSNAEKTAKALNAAAYTYGKNVVFGSGQYRPDLQRGRQLLAHELTHVIQQGGRIPAQNVVQRRVLVNPGGAVNDILNQFRFLCPGTWRNSGGRIVGHAHSTASQSCNCIENTVNNPGRTFTINVDAVTDVTKTETLHDGRVETMPYPSSGPRTYNGTNPTIHMVPSSGDAFEFGAFDSSGRARRTSNWRILAHELCGHGLLNQGYTQGGDYGKGNRPEHDSTIAMENAIAAEHGGIPRGYFNDPRQGESYHNLRSDRGKIVFKLVDGWHYQPVGAPVSPLPMTGTILGEITASALRIRQGPSTSSPILGIYPRGEIIHITCQTSGTDVLGNSLWDRTDRGYVSDKYVTRVRPSFIKLPTC